MDIQITATRDSVEKNVRYVRSPRQWVKITRTTGESGKGWHFARGYTGEVKAHTEYSIKAFIYTRTWEDAIDRAKQDIRSYE